MFFFFLSECDTPRNPIGYLRFIFHQEIISDFNKGGAVNVNAIIGTDRNKSFTIRQFSIGRSVKDFLLKMSKTFYVNNKKCVLKSDPQLEIQ